MQHNLQIFLKVSL